MKSKLQVLVLIIVFFFTSNILKAQWVQTNGPEYGWVYCFTTVGSRCFASTGSGVYNSVIGTYNWSQPITDLWEQEIRCLSTMDTDLFVAAHVNVFRSNDYGASYELVNIEGISHNISSLAVIDTILFCAVGGEGLYRSNDRGDTWEWLGSENPSDNICALAISDTILFAATSWDGVFRSDDFGDNWTSIDPDNVVDSISTIAAIDTYLYVGTENGEVLRSSVDGASWTAMSEGLPSVVVVAFASIENHVFVGTWEGVFHSTDYGESWDPVNEELLYTHVQDLYVIGTDLFAGTAGGIWRSSDYGASWSEENNGMKNADIRALTVEESGLYAGTWAGVFHSSDSGDHWTALHRAVAFCLLIDGTEIYSGGWGHVFYSSNEGLDWEAVNCGEESGSINALGKKGDLLFVGSEISGLLRTTHNGPGWWTLEQVGFVDTVINCIITDATHLYVGTEQGLFQSTDNGDTWTAINQGLTNLDIRALILNESYLFAGTWGGGIFRTELHGTSWTDVNNGLTNQDILSFVFSGENLFAGTWQGSINGGIFLSKDNGDHWYAVSDSIGYPRPIPGTVHGLAVDETYLLASELGKSVWRRSLSEIISSAESLSNHPPKSFNLNQNYPNPFNPKTVIRYTLPVTCHLDLSIYNTLGQKVVTLVSEQQPIGTYQIEWDASNFSSGLYFYTLKTNTGFKNTKKLILLK